MEAVELETLLLEGFPLLVGSTNVHTFQYSADEETLFVEFLNGSLYAYYDVPYEVAEKAFGAESPGRFVHRSLKNVYAYRRIKEPTRKTWQPTRIVVVRPKMKPMPGQHTGSVPGRGPR